MFDSELELVAIASQIEIAVAPSMEFGGASQCLSSAGVATFACMVHKYDSSLEVAL